MILLYAIVVTLQIPLDFSCQGKGEEDPEKNNSVEGISRDGKEVKRDVSCFLLFAKCRQMTKSKRMMRGLGK
jgi:hypothetical protein